MARALQPFRYVANLLIPTAGLKPVPRSSHRPNPSVANLLIPTAGLKPIVSTLVDWTTDPGRQPINPNCGTETVSLCFRQGLWMEVANLLIPTAGLKQASWLGDSKIDTGRQPINPNCGTETYKQYSVAI